MIRELTQDDFDAIAAELNNRPRQTLAFKAVRRVPAFGSKLLCSVGRAAG
jgi:IS30 family transposase